PLSSAPWFSGCRVVGGVGAGGELPPLCVITGGPPRGRPPRGDPPRGAGDRLFGDIDVKWPDGWISVHAAGAGAHDRCPFSRAGDDFVEGYSRAVTALPSGGFLLGAA